MSRTSPFTYGTQFLCQGADRQEFLLRFQTTQSTNVVSYCCFADGDIELFESVIKLQIEA